DARLRMVQERMRMRRTGSEHKQERSDCDQGTTSHGQLPLKGACRLDRAAKQRLTDSLRIYVIEIEVQLRDDADIAAALAVDGDQRFDADLERVADPQHPGI